MCHAAEATDKDRLTLGGNPESNTRLVVRDGPDLPLLLLVALTLLGYVFFTWRNPWFAAIKGT